MSTSDRTNTASNAAGKVAKVVILSLFALILVVVSVSFAVHHMRLGFEKEFRKILVSRIKTDATNASLAISGDEIVIDPAYAAERYSAVLPYMLMDSNDDDYTTQAFGLYSYTNGSLAMLTGNDSNLLVASKIPVSEWLTSEQTPYEMEDKYVYHYMVPITDSENKVVGLLELSAQNKEIGDMGNKLESMILSTVIAAVLVAMALFAVQYIVPPIISLVSNKNTEAKL